ncbi:MAG: coth protein-domain-containing protein [Podila humilis]|nr:MAG: coth protein-domain-containing protein [Podila humilis]
MHILHLSSLLVLVSSVLADGFPDAETNTYAVEVNGELYPLQTSKDLFPLWSTRVDGVSAPSSYRYVQLNHKNKEVAREEFLRSLTDKNTTLNEFFNRETTLTTLPAIKQVYKNVHPKDDGVFDSSQIATIHLTVDPLKFDDMMNNPLAKDPELVEAGFKFINANKVYSTDKVYIKVSGNASRKFRKVSLRVVFNKNKRGMFFGRSDIKLRAEYIDPTMLREKLYLDLLRSVGVGSSQGSYSRVYVNGKPHGLYLMIEDVGESMLMHTIHHDAIKDKNALGSLYQMSTTLEFKGPRAADYVIHRHENKIRGDNPMDEPMQQLIAFMKDLQDWDPTDTEGIAYWNERLDVDGFLRSMALEYLTGAWDSFWWNGHNYYMYYNPQNKIWQFIPTDFDHTFNAGGRLNANETYKEFAQRCEGPNPKSNSNPKSITDHKSSPLVTKLICKNKDINKKFETILLKITHDVFNNAALEERVHAYETQLEQEVGWDISIDRSRLPGAERNRKIKNFHKSIWGPKSSHKVGRKRKGIMFWIESRSNSVAHHFAK